MLTILENQPSSLFVLLQRFVNFFFTTESTIHLFRRFVFLMMCILLVLTNWYLVTFIVIETVYIFAALIGYVLNIAAVFILVNIKFLSNRDFLSALLFCNLVPFLIVVFSPLRVTLMYQVTIVTSGSSMIMACLNTFYL